ncbi:MAG: methyltransferase domain-containing protein [Bacteroidales bacterium]|jgi:SAM-dependent methyltransferase|nr:methyltransferase domain-containing protein [Bacteroidales bacterium]NLK55009.1 methyltransferase domain-containing protein [Bacteroidales bacterium]HPV17343.1 class I SAM-dependent methyltransferase [Bacteroidales bacterium]HQB87303.1 class I SAM-dependent methyltransferase [Bacteroidales bacterium]
MMKTFRYFISALVALIVSSSLLTLQAQEKASVNNYVPEVGQQGKDVVWVPTPQELVNKMLEVAKVTPADYVIDLGSGDGRTVISAAKIGAKATGIEYNPDMVALSKENALKEGVGNKAEFIQADLYETDLSKATVITMFLLPEINLKLRPRILDLKPGTRIVSNTFTMGEWEADQEVTTEENWNSWNTAYLWIVPAKVGGKWKMGDGELELTQEFQFVRGSFKTGIRSQSVTDGRLEGNKLSFRINNDVYTGVVSDRTIRGTASNTAEGKTWDWTATR